MKTTDSSDDHLLLTGLLYEKQQDLLLSGIRIPLEVVSTTYYPG